MRNILITGASGFIGSALCRDLASENRIKGLYCHHRPDYREGVSLERVDLQDSAAMIRICREFMPDQVIHCAGIAHQGQGTVSRDDYFRINSEAAAISADAAFRANPRVHFIHLSSVSVYGETESTIPLDETHPCKPAGDYALSKLAAEKRLTALTEKNAGSNIRILRLAPVYDADWHFNLDRRILLPGKMAFLRVGSGRQRMSALARPNLVAFVRFIIDQATPLSSSPEIMNICDAEPYSFRKIIHVYQKSGLHSRLPVIWMPLSAVFLMSRLWGLIDPRRRQWIHAAYEKLAHSQIYDNRKMMQSGFRARHSLERVFMESETLPDV